MVICEVEHQGVVGYGEASPSTRVTGETIDSVSHFLDWAADEIAPVPPDKWASFLDHVHDTVAGNPSARAALDLAVHDLVGKLRGLPVRALYDLPPARLETCMTVSLDAPAAMATEAAEYRARGFRALKLKLGRVATDLDCVRAARDAVPDARLRVDANTAWSAADARRLLPGLADLGVEFVEQPVHPSDRAGLIDVTRDSPVPIYADESVLDVHDVRSLHDEGFTGGYNLKLQKTGGIRPAVLALREGKALGHKLQLGCNVETAVGIAAGVQLLHLLDHADLDGHLLLADQPFHGPLPNEGWYETPPKAGLGVRPA